MMTRQQWLLPAMVLLTQFGSTIIPNQFPFAQNLNSAMAETIVAQAPPPGQDGGSADRMPPPPDGASPDQMPLPPWARNINLSDDQRSRLQAIRDKARQEGKALHDQLKAEEEKLRSLLKNPDSSLEALRKQHQAIIKLRSQMDTQRFEILLAERQVLTKEQLAQAFDNVRQQRRP